jgi:hypothetical protein
MTDNGFNVGDRVRCINADDVASGHLTAGSEYIVDHLDGGNVALQGVRHFSGKLWTWKPHRFELIAPAPLVHEHEGRQYQETERYTSSGLSHAIRRGSLVIVAEPLPGPTVMVEVPQYAAGYMADVLADAADEASPYLVTVAKACRAALEDQ